MKLAPDPETAAWLAEGPELEWDEGNRTKSETKHGFTPEDTASALVNALLLGRIAETEHGEPRFLAVGRTGDGWYAAVVFTRRGARLRPISTRPMRDAEKEAFHGR